jgi:cysteine desulfurase
LRKPVYLDFAATTPVAPLVAERMMQCLTLDGIFANPASRSHRYGWQAEALVEEARAQVAGLINADPRTIVWTSGATEANNLVLKGVAETYRREHKTGGHIIVSSIEHKAVLDPATWLEAQGFSVTCLLPNSSGIIDAKKLSAALRDDTFLVSIMSVNNELGSINPIADLVKICEGKNIFFHTDAAQALGKIAIDVNKLGVDLLSLSAHKFYGPKGVGALYVKRRADLQLAAQMHGGGHERGMRSGTLATHQLVGMGAAAELIQQDWQADDSRIKQLRNRLWQGIKDLSGVKLNTDVENAVSSILNIAFSGIDGETLLLSLQDLAISSGSACNSASMSPSYVLKAIGLNDADAQSSLRFSLGNTTTEEEIDFAITQIRTLVKKIKG